MNAKTVYWCDNLSELVEFVAYVVLSAPDDFPEEDKMDLERAFHELRHGFECAAKEVGMHRLSRAQGLLDQAHTLYRSGQTNEGAWKLQEMQQLLMAL